jgi:hypothetical protein
MAGSDYLPDIRRSIGPNESDDDIVSMIDILADERATFSQRPAEENDFQFSAVIWCVLMQPIKPPAFRSAIIQIRLSFRGVATSYPLQNRLRKSFTKTLLGASTVQASIAQGVNALFILSRHA